MPQIQRKSAGVPQARSEYDCLVLIASGAPSVVKRWRQALRGVYAVAQAANPDTMCRHMSLQKPSVVLFDLNLKRRQAPKLIKQLLRLNPQAKILTFSETLGEKECVELVRAGARGCCNIHVDTILLKKAIQMVKKGELWIERRYLSYMLADLLTAQETSRADATRARARLEGLTAREMEIVERIGKGESNKEIAARLDITEATVKAHLTNIFAKLGVSGRLGVALMVHGESSTTHRLSADGLPT